MRELMLKMEYLERSSIYIGKVGESNSTRIKINAVYWRNKFSNISFEAIYQRADGISYPVNISIDKNYIIWDISRKDLYKAGTAYFTLIGYELEKKVISTTAMCFVNPGINGITIDSEYTEDPTPTDWIQSVIDEVGDLKNSIYAEIESAISSAGHLKREIVDELPNLEVADKDTIYMIKRVDSDDYIEYIVIESKGTKRFEQIGDTAIDLSGYALSADVIQRVNDSEGYVPKFTADGTLTSTNFKLGKSIPADAIFTDITQVAANNGLNANITDRSLTLGITSISTDLLVNGANTLIINCGSAT